MFKPTQNDKKKILEAATLLLDHFDGCDEDVVLQGLLQTLAAAQGGGASVALNRYNAAGDCLVAAVSLKHQGRMQEARALAQKALVLDGIEELATQLNASNDTSYREIASDDFYEEIADDDSTDDDEEEESDYSDRPSSLSKHARKRRLRQAKA